MAQQTEVETPTARSENNSAPQETHSAAEPPSPRASSQPLASRPHARVIFVIVLLLLLVGGFFAYEYFQTYESTDDAEVDGHLMPLSARISGYEIGRAHV